MWQGIVGHDEIVEQFRRTLAAGRLASTYLFVGPPGVGKRRFAIELARSLLCTEATEEKLAPCGHCESCRIFAAGNHPDLEVVGLRPDTTQLAISQFVGFDEVLKQDALCHRLALKSFFGKRRVAIINDADHFNLYSANCLLKTLEEPPPSALLILIGTSPSRQLPTIRSRSQLIRFQPLASDTVAQILLDTGVVSDRDLAVRISEISEGSVERAMQLTEPALWDFREQVSASFSADRFDGVRLMRQVQAFVDEAGKESSQKRDRLRIVIGFAAEFYRSLMRNELAPNSALLSLDACLTALEQIDRNANVGLVIQTWCESLAKSRGKMTFVGSY